MLPIYDSVWNWVPPSVIVKYTNTLTSPVLQRDSASIAGNGSKKSWSRHWRFAMVFCCQMQSVCFFIMAPIIEMLLLILTFELDIGARAKGFKQTRLRTLQYPEYQATYPFPWIIHHQLPLQEQTSHLIAPSSSSQSTLPLQYYNIRVINPMRLHLCRILSHIHPSQTLRINHPVFLAICPLGIKAAA